MKSDRLSSILEKYLRVLNFDISKEEIYEEFLIHPDHPSLFAISDVLSSFGVENKAFTIVGDQLHNLPCPFLAITKYGDTFTLVNSINGEDIFISNKKLDNHKLDLNNFKNLYDGVVLIGKPAEKFTLNLRNLFLKLKVPLLITALATALILAILYNSNYVQNFSLQIICITFSKFMGLFISTLLIVQSIDNNNSFVRRICKINGKRDCNAILGSKAAQVFDGLSWSEIGLFYFAGTFSIIIFGDSSNAVMQTLLLLNLVSLPYTIYSIIYQAFIAKKWCVLCTMVQILLWIEFFPLLYFYHSPITLPTASEFNGIIIAFLIPIAVWLLLKPLFLNYENFNAAKQQLQKSKFNSEIFKQVINNQKKISQPSEDCSIILGNPRADNTITLVTNPYCPPCAVAHTLLDKLLKQRSDIRASILFTAENTESDLQTPVSRHFMNLNALADKTIIKQALNDWYEQRQKNYHNWSKRYPTKFNKEDIDKITKQKVWCTMNNIQETPTILVNGYILPDLYQISDLKYLL